MWTNEQSGKTLAKISLIEEHWIDSDEEELISELGFEIENSSVYDLNYNGESKEEESFMIIEREED